MSLGTHQKKSYRCLEKLKFICLHLFAGSESCGDNEEFLDCYSKCNESCAAHTGDRNCGTGCKAGCFCKEGYARHEAGTCISINECPGM